MAHPDGDSDRIELFRGLPFALFQTTVHNADKETRIIRSVRPWQAESELGIPAGRLTTLGTGGLLAPDRNPGSYAWLALADPESRRGIVAGWLTSERGSGIIFSPVDHGQAGLSTQIDYGRLRLAYFGHSKTPGDPGGGMLLPTPAWDWNLVGGRGGARVRHIKLPPQPTVFCTWYAPKPYGAASDEVHLAQLADFAAFPSCAVRPVRRANRRSLAGMASRMTARSATSRRLIRAVRIPHGMKAAAEHVSSLGLTHAGLWFLPFAGTSYDPVYRDHRDWFVKTADGQPYEVKWGGTCLDLTYPPAREHVREVVNRIVHDWGFRYLKIDGLWTGTATKIEYVNTGYKDDGMGDAVFANPEKTNVEAFRDGLKLVRATAGEGVFIDGCNTPQNMRTYGAAMGLVDGMPDRTGQQGGVGGVMLRGPTSSAPWQYFLHGRVWYNDPDPIYVRPEVPLSEARALCSWAALSGQMNTSSEWYPGLPAERLDLLRRTMPGPGRRGRPVDLLEAEIPRIWLLSDAPGAKGRNVVGLFNWGNAPATIGGSLAHLGLPAGGTYEVFDYWTNRLLPPVRGALCPPGSGAFLRGPGGPGGGGSSPIGQHLPASSRRELIDVLEETWDPAGEDLERTQPRGGRRSLRIAHRDRRRRARTVGRWRPPA